MRRVSSLFLALLCGIMLAQTNPRHKAHYVTYVAQNFQTFCCDADSEPSQVSTCEKLWPVTTPILQGILHLYTEAPRDYVLFTQYTTRLPGYAIYGIGIGGQFIVWPREPLSDNACEILHDSFFSRS